MSKKKKFLIGAAVFVVLNLVALASLPYVLPPEDAGQTTYVPPTPKPQVERRVPAASVEAPPSASVAPGAAKQMSAQERIIASRETPRERARRTRQNPMTENQVRAIDIVIGKQVKRVYGWVPRRAELSDWCRHNEWNTMDRASSRVQKIDNAIVLMWIADGQSVELAVHLAQWCDSRDGINIAGWAE